MGEVEVNYEHSQIGVVTFKEFRHSGSPNMQLAIIHIPLSNLSKPRM
jgi:hypothetical protein